MHVSCGLKLDRKVIQKQFRDWWGQQKAWTWGFVGGKRSIISSHMDRLVSTAHIKSSCYLPSQTTILNETLIIQSRPSNAAIKFHAYG